MEELEEKKESDATANDDFSYDSDRPNSKRKERGKKEEILCHFEKVKDVGENNEAWPVKFVLGTKFDREVFLNSFRHSLNPANFEDKKQMNDWKELIARIFRCSTEDLKTEDAREGIAENLEKLYDGNVGKRKDGNSIDEGWGSTLNMTSSNSMKMSENTPLLNLTSYEKEDEIEG